jgi:L-malate glycosyltransferase
MIRIAYVIDFIDSPMGGTERQLELLIRNLDRDRFLPHLICLKRTAWQDENSHALNIVTFDVTRHGSPRAYVNLLRLAAWLVRQRIDIVQTHYQDGNLVGTLAGVISGRRVVSTRRGDVYWPGDAGQRRLRFLDRFARGFLANSRATARRVIEMEKVPSRKVHVVYNGTRYLEVPAPTPAERVAILARHGLDPADTHIVAVGNLRPVKRHDLLLRAVGEVLPQFPRARFLIIGAGALREELAALAEREGITPAVRFLGEQPEVFPILQAADIGVLCSDFESLPNAVIEYMVAGLPVVCTDTGGNPELVREGGNGFLVPRNDPRAVAERLLRLLGDRAQASRMGAESRRVAERSFSVEAMVAQTSAFYEDLLSTAGRK